MMGVFWGAPLRQFSIVSSEILWLIIDQSGRQVQALLNQGTNFDFRDFI